MKSDKDGPDLFSTQELRPQEILNLMNETRSFGFVGDYKIRGILGRGASAVVYRATGHDGNDIALKVFSESSDLSTTELKRFLREARSLSKLRDHPNIVTVHEIGKDDINYFIAMDLVSTGETLSKRLEEEGALPRDEALDIAIQIASAIGYVHDSGFVHRDIKPSNILLNEDSTPILTDFGLVQVFDSNLTIDGSVLGTPGYVSPEILERGSVHANISSDIYSFGILLYKMLTGNLPFNVDPDLPLSQSREMMRKQDPIHPSKFVKHLGSDLTAILFKMIERDPENRYSNMLEVQDDLRACRGGTHVRAQLPSTGDQVDRWLKRHRMKTIFLAVAAIVVLGTGLVLLERKKEREQTDVNKQLEFMADPENRGDKIIVNKVETEAQELRKRCQEALSKNPEGSRQLLEDTQSWARTNRQVELERFCRASLARLLLRKRKFAAAYAELRSLAEDPGLGRLPGQVYRFEAGVCKWVAQDYDQARKEWEAVGAPTADVEKQRESSYIEDLCAFLLGRMGNAELQASMAEAGSAFRALGYWSLAQSEEKADSRRQHLRRAAELGSHYFVWMKMEE